MGVSDLFDFKLLKLNLIMSFCTLPQVGHGVFADDQSAGVSCTGEGEAFMKTGIARRVASNAEAGASASQAIEEALRYRVRKK